MYCDLLSTYICECSVRKKLPASLFQRYLQLLHGWDVIVNYINAPKKFCRCSFCRQCKWSYTVYIWKRRVLYCFCKWTLFILYFCYSGSNEERDWQDRQPTLKMLPLSLCRSFVTLQMMQTQRLLMVHMPQRKAKWGLQRHGPYLLSLVACSYKSVST